VTGQEQVSPVDPALTKIRETMGLMGRILSQSKSGYRGRHPSHIVVFNSNLFVVIDGQPYKAWFGDIDITLEEGKLKALANQLGVRLGVLRENFMIMNEDNPTFPMPVWQCDKDVSMLGSDYDGLWERNPKGQLVLKEDS